MALDVSGQTQALELAEQERTAEDLIPRIRTLFQDAQLEAADIDRFAVATGPGSFTGIRIGITTIKTMAYALGKKIAPVNSLSAVAETAKLTGSWSSSSLTVVINAFRQQLFVCRFDWNDFAAQAAAADDRTRVISQADFVTQAESHHGLLVGPGLAALPQQVQDRLTDRMIPQSQVGNTALGVSSLGHAHFAENRVVDAISLLPNYFRGSAAEEKLLAK